MGKLATPSGSEALDLHNHKLVFMNMTVEILKGSNWAGITSDSLGKHIKAAVEQLADSYNEL